MKRDSCWLVPIFLCSCTKFGEFDSISESPKRCNGVFKESSQWPPAVLKLIPEKKKETQFCVIPSPKQTKKNKLIFTNNNKKSSPKESLLQAKQSLLFVGTVRNTNIFFGNGGIFSYFHLILKLIFHIMYKENT